MPVFTQLFRSCHNTQRDNTETTSILVPYAKALRTQILGQSSQPWVNGARLNGEGPQVAHQAFDEGNVMAYPGHQVGDNDVVALQFVWGNNRIRAEFTRC